MADPEEPKPEAEEADPPRERAEPEPDPSDGKPAKKKKAKVEAEGEGTEAIRDRNRRIREEAAAKRRAKRQEATTAQRSTRNLDTSEVVDDALARSTHALGAWLKRHFNVIQWVIVAGLVGWIGWEIYDWRRERAIEKTSDDLAKGLHAEEGLVGAAPETEPGIEDPRRVFSSDDERLKAAAEKYKAAAGGKSDAAILARLALAGVEYDSGKLKEARASYEAVKNSGIATRDRDVKGRALEGLGMTLEALGDKDAALKTFRELENSDIVGFGALGLYHQARVLHAKGESEKAKELLTKADAKIKDTKDASVTGYLPHAIRELMQLIDPEAASKLKSSLPSELMDQLNAADSQEQGGEGVSAEKLQELLREVSKRVGADAGTPLPAPPASAPR